MEESKLTDKVGILSLAFMGDAIYEERIRNHIIIECPTLKVNEHHKEAVKYVRASAQAYAVLELIKQGELSEEETTVVKRGRNHAGNSPKNANVAEYRYATGFEALLGYLYFSGEKDRMEEIVRKSIEFLNKFLDK